MRFLIFVVLIILCAIFGMMSGFTPEPNHIVETCTNPAGGFEGFIHGFLLFWTSVFSFFADVGVYETCNTGGWYNFGFLIGVIFWFGGSTSSASSTRK